MLRGSVRELVARRGALLQQAVQHVAVARSDLRTRVLLDEMQLERADARVQVGRVVAQRAQAELEVEPRRRREQRGIAPQPESALRQCPPREVTAGVDL